MSMRWNGPNEDEPNQERRRGSRRKSDLIKIHPFEVLDKLRLRWHNQSMETTTQEGATMKRYVGFYTDGDVTVDSPMLSVDFFAFTWEGARNKFEIFTSSNVAMPMGLFAIPDSSTNEDIERLAVEFHRQWTPGNRDNAKLDAAIRPRASRMVGTD